MMSHFSDIYNLRHKIVKIGLPALISRGTLAIWGILTIFIIRSLPPEAYAIYGGFGAAIATTAAVVFGAAWILIFTTRYIRK